jgi:hypothetical protein
MGSRMCLPQRRRQCGRRPKVFTMVRLVFSNVHSAVLGDTQSPDSLNVMPVVNKST